MLRSKKKLLNKYLSYLRLNNQLTRTEIATILDLAELKFFELNNEILEAPLTSEGRLFQSRYAT